MYRCGQELTYVMCCLICRRDQSISRSSSPECEGKVEFITEFGGGSDTETKKNPVVEELSAKFPQSGHKESSKAADGDHTHRKSHDLRHGRKRDRSRDRDRSHDRRPHNRDVSCDRRSRDRSYDKRSHDRRSHDRDRSHDRNRSYDRDRSHNHRERRDSRSGRSRHHSHYRYHSPVRSRATGNGSSHHRRDSYSRSRSRYMIVQIILLSI